MDLHVSTNSAPQDAYVFSDVFEILYGGRARGGKTFGMALAAILPVEDGDYSAVLFRRTFPELEGKEGLIDVTREMYPAAGGVYHESKHTWTFPSGAIIRLAHMANVGDYIQHAGPRYALVGFDELSHFEEIQYRYLFSRLSQKSDSKLETRMIAASNPGARWVFLRWRPWLDSKHPHPAESGEVRWFKSDGMDSELECEPGDPDGWSRTFIAADYRDNPAINQAKYSRNLDLLPYIERRRLKFGDWEIAEGRGTVLNREWFKYADSVPDGCQVYRAWDWAATEAKIKTGSGPKRKDPDYTATCYLATDGENFYIRLDRRRWTWKLVREWVRGTFKAESWCVHGGEEEPGASGKVLTFELAEMATEYGVGWIPLRPDTNKVAQAMRWSKLAEDGRVYLLPGGESRENVVYEFHNFPDGDYDDMVDATSKAFAMVGISIEL